MKKRLLSTLLALTLCLGPALPALAAEEDFVIEDGVLVAYNGHRSEEHTSELQSHAY